ncbi:MAG: hypothetical protein ACI4DK_07170 [Lachnospiraceae bacterium]
MDKKYTCAICGKSYDTIEERIKCETKCLENRKKAEAEAKKNEYEAKRQEAMNSVYKALSNAEDAIANFYKSYDTLTLKDDYHYLKYLFGYKSFWF